MGGKTEQITELHYQKLGAALHAKLALRNILVGGVCLFSSQLTVYKNALAAESISSLDHVDDFSDKFQQI